MKSKDIVELLVNNGAEILAGNVDKHRQWFCTVETTIGNSAVQFRLTVDELTAWGKSLRRR